MRSLQITYCSLWWIISCISLLFQTIFATDIPVYIGVNFCDCCANYAERIKPISLLFAYILCGTGLFAASLFISRNRPLKIKLIISIFCIRPQRVGRQSLIDFQYCRMLPKCLNKTEFNQSFCPFKNFSKEFLFTSLMSRGKGASCV